MIIEAYGLFGQFAILKNMDLHFIFHLDCLLVRMIFLFRYFAGMFERLIETLDRGGLLHLALG